MASTLDTACDNVVTALASGTPAFTAVKVFDPSVDLSDLVAGRVAVVPKKIALLRLTRGLFQKQVEIDIAVQQKLAEFMDDATDKTAIAACLERAEQVAVKLASATLSGGEQPTQIEVPASYSADDLRQERVVTSVITASYVL